MAGGNQKSRFGEVKRQIGEVFDEPPGDFFEGDVPAKIVAHRIVAQPDGKLKYMIVELLVKWKKRADKTRPQSTWYTNAALLWIVPELLANYLHSLFISQTQDKIVGGKIQKKIGNKHQSSSRMVDEETVIPNYKRRSRKSVKASPSSSCLKKKSAVK